MSLKSLKKAFNLSLVFFVALALIVISLVFFRYLENPVQTYPYPYKVGIKLDTEEKALAESADILLLGDSLGVYLDQFLNPVIQESSKDFERKINFYNWSKPNETLSVTLYKLRSLKKVPSLVIYHGGAEEYQRARFFLKDMKALQENLKTVKNDLLYSLALSNGHLSRVVYSPMKRVQIEEAASSYPETLKSDKKQKVIEYTHEIYKQEVKDLVKLLKEKEANAVLITSALNLRRAPKENCQNTTNSSIEKELLKLEARLKQNLAKLVINDLEKLASNTIANAKAFWLLGEAHYQLGNLPQARKAYHRSLIYDCSLKRGGDALFNLSLVNEFEEEGFDVIDFHALTQRSLAREPLFDVDLFPRTSFYQDLTLQIKESMINHFSLKESP